MYEPRYSLLTNVVLFTYISNMKQLDIVSRSLGDQTEAHLGGVVRKVLPSELHLVRDHLQRLDADARQRRFSHNVTDAFIDSYTAKLGNIGNMTFAYFIEGRVTAVAELKRTRIGWGHVAEAAFSVERDFANKGLATLLMGRVIRSARNRGIRQLQLYCMADNAKMQAIARHYHADLRFEDGAVIADIVPKHFDYLSLVAEAFEDRFAIAHAVIEMQNRIVRSLKA